MLSLVLLWYYHVICHLSEGGGEARLLAIHSQLHTINQVIKIKKHHGALTLQSALI